MAVTCSDLLTCLSNAAGQIQWEKVRSSSTAPAYELLEGTFRCDNMLTLGLELFLAWSCSLHSMLPVTALLSCLCFQDAMHGPSI